MMPLSHDADLPTLTPVDGLLLDQLRAVLPEGATLDVTAAGPLADAAADLLDLPEGDESPLTIRVISTTPEPDVTALVHDMTAGTLLLVGPVGTLAESRVLRALALACDADALTLTPLHTLHPMAHGSTLATVTPPTGPAADVLVALGDALTADYEFVEMAFENNRLQFAIQDHARRAAQAHHPAPPPAQPAPPPAPPAPPPGGLKRVYHTLVPLSVRLWLRDRRVAQRDRLKSLYHRVFTLEMRLRLRDLRWRLLRRNRG